MTTLYHYTKAKSLKHILENGGLKMTNPNDFNDPYDCVLFEDAKDYKDVHKLIKNYIIFFVLSDLTIRDYCFSKIKDQLIFGTVAKEIKLMQKLLAKQPMYIYMPILDKVFDVIVNSGPLVKRKYEEEMEKWDRKVVEALNKTRNNTIVACFSKGNDSVLMWSHYADCHKGVCLEYEINEDEFLKEVDYSKKLVGIKLYKMMSNVLACDYLKRNNIEFVNNFKPDEDVFKPFYTKSLDWKYEEEVRYVFYTNDENDNVQFIENKYILKVGKPKAIFIGSKINEEYLNEITDIAKEYNIPVHQSKLNDSIYKIDILP